MCISGESKNAMAAIDKLGQEYAHLLGHQNHKQKIKHIEKMRAEKQALTKVSIIVAISESKVHYLAIFSFICNK